MGRALHQDQSVTKGTDAAEERASIRDQKDGAGRTSWRQAYAIWTPEETSTAFTNLIVVPMTPQEQGTET